MSTIVQFENGTFGIRKTTLFGYRFLDITHYEYDAQKKWYDKKNSYFHTRCRASQAGVLKCYDKLHTKDTGTPINRNEVI